MSYDFIVLGDLVADLIIPVKQLPIMPNQHGWAEGIFVEPGGAGNVLVAARRLNLSTACLGTIGGDRYGAEMLAMLGAEGVDTRHVTLDPTRMTMQCIVMTDVAAQHVYLGVKDQLGVLPFDASWHAVIRESRALFTDGYTLRDMLTPDDFLAALTTARHAGVPVYFDPGPSAEFVSTELMNKTLAVIDVLLLTDDEAELLCDARGRDAVVHTLLARGPRMVVLKHGAAGCTVATADATRSYPGFPVNVVDTVGAGDSFAAALIAGLLRGASLDDAATLANAMGALVTTSRGAGTRIPSREALLALLDAHPGARAVA